MEALNTRHYTEKDYYEMPDDVRVELIDGEIYYMASPTLTHQRLIISIAGKIGDFIDSHKGPCQVLYDFDTRLFSDEDTIVRPDISVICDKDKLTERRCEGPPDWIIEVVSKSNASNDYVRKTNLYDRAGVKEYWIVDPAEKTVYVYHFGTEDFRVKHYSFRDRVPAGIYEDFTIDFSEIDDHLQG